MNKILIFLNVYFIMTLQLSITQIYFLQMFHYFLVFGFILHFCYTFQYLFLWSWVIIIIPVTRPAHMTFSWVVLASSPMRTEYSMLVLWHCTCPTSPNVHKSTAAFFCSVIRTIVHIMISPRTQNTPWKSRLYAIIFTMFFAKYLVVYL